MDREVSIVLSVEKRNYRKVAQTWYGLTDEQMIGMDVHHNPAASDGGRNIPEHLFVYHNTLHAAVHKDDFVLWSRTGGALGAAAVHKERDELGRSLHSLRIHQVRDDLGRSVLGVKNAERLHAEKDELGRSVHGVRAAERMHAEKDEFGRSVAAIKGNTVTHSEKDDLGRSIHGLKASERLNAEKDESGKSINAVKGGVRGAEVIRKLGVGIFLKENQVKGGLATGPIPVWNNGEKQIKSWTRPGEGWVRGNIPHENSLKALKKNGELPWWTDGICEKRSHITPGDGWKPGRSPKPLTANFNYESARESGRKSMNQRYVDPDHLELGSKPAAVLVRMQKSRGYPHGRENRVRIL